MADNISIKDGAGATVVLASKDVGAVQYPKRIAVDGTGAEVAVATSAMQTANGVLLGAVAEAAPASDTASSGLNGRLQRIAQRITSLIALLPTALGQGTMAQSLRVVLASDQSVIPVVGAAAHSAVNTGNPVKIGAAYNTTPAVNTDGDVVDLQATARGILLTTLSNDGVTNVAIAAGALSDGLAGGNGLYVMSQARKFNGTTWDRDRKPNATSLIPSSAATLNATVAKASAGDVHCVSGVNASAGVIYLKLYAKATAPVVASDTPAVVLALPTGAFNLNLNGHYLSSGISYVLTTGAAHTDATGIAAADILGLTITYA